MFSYFVTMGRGEGGTHQCSCDIKELLQCAMFPSFIAVDNVCGNDMLTIS